VRRILITGRSAVGKSSVVRALVARGHRAVDTDDGWTVLDEVERIGLGS